MSQVIIKVTDRTYRKNPKNMTSLFGSASGSAMERKKNKDYLPVLHVLYYGQSRYWSASVSRAHHGRCG